MHKFFANSLFIGKKLEYLPHCHSTNTVAAEMIEQGLAPEGTLIITDNQTKSKGQRGNSWESEPGKNLTFSVVLAPKFLSIKDQFYLNMIVSLSVAELLRSELGDKVKVKWPNDVYAGDSKICGILIENALRGGLIENSVVGIGLNVNQQQFTVDKATSLSELTLKQYALETVLEELIKILESYYLKLRTGELVNIKKEYKENLYWAGETHLFQSTEVFSGEIVDVDEQGKIVIASAGSLKSFDIKEIAFVR